MNIQNQNTYSVSNILIIICLFVTVIALTYKELYIYGMNTYFLERGLYVNYITQFFTSQFIHGSMFHFIFNALFIFIFGNMVESILGYKKYILFFLFSSVFIGLSLTFLSTGNTVGISGFAMALLSYYTFELYYKNDIEYKGGITALVINIGIGFTPGISLMGHLSGSIAGILFYFIYRKYFSGKSILNLFDDRFRL